jgi:hypothetical protein
VTPREYLTLMALIERADNCLYAVKRQGRNRFVCETDQEPEPRTNPETRPPAQVA